MPNQVIDLRKTVSPNPPGVAKNPVDSRGKKFPELLEWSAYEYEKGEQKPNWFLMPGIIALLLVIFGILARSYFFIAFVVLAFTVLIMYTKKAPQRISVTLTKEGVSVGSKIHKFSDIKSFWVFDKPEIKELSLETEKTLSPFVRLPLGDTDPEELKNFLRDFLPEEEHKEFVSDQIARSMGL